MADESKKYSCYVCANQGTELCELCMKITAPSGRERKPSHFIRLRDIAQCSESNSEIEYLAETIGKYLKARTPLPVVAVLEYNRRTEEDTV